MTLAKTPLRIELSDHHVEPPEFCSSTIVCDLSFPQQFFDLTA